MYLMKILGGIEGEGNAFPWILLRVDLPLRAGNPRNAPPATSPQNTRSPLKPHSSTNRRLSRVSYHLPVCLEYRFSEVRVVFDLLGDTVPGRTQGFPRFFSISFCVIWVIPLPCAYSPCASPADQKSGCFSDFIPTSVKEECR